MCLCQHGKLFLSIKIVECIPDPALAVKSPVARVAFSELRNRLQLLISRVIQKKDK